MLNNGPRQRIIERADGQRMPEVKVAKNKIGEQNVKLTRGPDKVLVASCLLRRYNPRLRAQ